MLQIYSIVYNYTLKKINSHAYINRTYNEGKPLNFGTFVLKKNFQQVQYSDKLKPLKLVHIKLLIVYLTLPMNFLLRMALHFTLTEII